MSMNWLGEWHTLTRAEKLEVGWVLFLVTLVVIICLIALVTAVWNFIPRVCAW